MRIAVLSGKGRTGKTFVSVNLACAAAIFLMKKGLKLSLEHQEKQR